MNAAPLSVDHNSDVGHVSAAPRLEHPLTEVVAYLDRRERADLIVTDLHMPEVDGWKLCRLVRSREYGPYNDTPILATSAVFCGEEAQSLTAGLGANALLRAPFTSAELIRCVKDLLTGEIPSIKTRLLLIPFPGKRFRGLANCFRRFGYEVLEEPDPELAVKHLEVWKPAVVIIDHDHDGIVLDKVLKRERQAASFNANLVVDIGPLAGKALLSSLFFENNFVVDLLPLAALPELRRLRLRGNEVADISVLMTLEKLLSVDLRNNPLSEGSLALIEEIAKGNIPRVTF